MRIALISSGEPDACKLPQVSEFLPQVATAILLMLIPLELSKTESAHAGFTLKVFTASKPQEFQPLWANSSLPRCSQYTPDTAGSKWLTPEIRKVFSEWRIALWVL